MNDIDSFIRLKHFPVEYSERFFDSIPEDVKQRVCQDRGYITGDNIEQVFSDLVWVYVNGYRGRRLKQLEDSLVVFLAEYYLDHDT